MKMVRKIQILIVIVVVVVAVAFFTRPDLKTFQSQLKTSLQGEATTSPSTSGLDGLFRNKLNEWSGAAIEKAVQNAVAHTDRILWSEFTVDPDVASMIGIPSEYTGAFGKVFGLDELAAAVKNPR